MPIPFLTTLITLAIVSVCLLGSSTASAQTMSHPDMISPMKPNPYLKHNEPWRWDIRSQIFLRHGYITYSNGQYREQISGSFKIRDFEYIYPIVRQGGHYWSPNEEIDTSFRLGDIKFQPDSKVLQTPESGVPYVWWQSDQRGFITSQLHFTQISHIVAADTIFNEQLAKELPWPKDWLPDAERFLTPIIDELGSPIDVLGQDELAALVNQWLEGNDPKSISEVTLVKFLTGKVLEFVRVTRSNFIYSPTISIRRPPGTSLNNSFTVNGGFSTYPRSSWTGFIVRSADQVALDPSGSILDVATLLTAVLRTAGVPARTVVCYINNDLYVDEDRINSLVEFAIYDPQNDQILWIPIDPKLLVDNGRRSASYEQNWDYFGTHDRLHYYVPLAYYFHPPVNYSAYGYPALYGFKSDLQPKSSSRNTPRSSNISQILSIDVVSSPLRGDELNQNTSP